MTEPTVIYAEDCEAPAFRHGPGHIGVRAWAAAPRHNQVYGAFSTEQGGIFVVEASSLAEALRPGPSDDDHLDLDSRMTADACLMKGSSVVGLAVDNSEMKLAAMTGDGVLTVFNLPMKSDTKNVKLDLEIGPNFSCMEWINGGLLLVAALDTVMCCKITADGVTVLARESDVNAATSLCLVGDSTVAVADSKGEPERVCLWDTLGNSLTYAEVEDLNDIFTGDDMLANSAPWVVHSVCSLREDGQFAVVLGPPVGAKGVSYSAVAIVEARKDRGLVAKTVIMDPYFVESECSASRPAGWSSFIRSRGLLICGHACSGQVAVIEEPHEGFEDWSCWVGPEGRQLGCAVEGEANLGLGGPPVTVDLSKPMSLPVTAGTSDLVDVYRMVLLPHSDSKTSSVHFVEDRPDVGIPVIGQPQKSSFRLEFAASKDKPSSVPEKAEQTKEAAGSDTSTPAKQSSSPFGVFGGGQSTSGFGAFGSPASSGGGFGAFGAASSSSSSSSGFGAFGTPPSSKGFGAFGSSSDSKGASGGFAAFGNPTSTSSISPFGGFGTASTPSPFGGFGSGVSSGFGVTKVADEPEKRGAAKASGKEKSERKKAVAEEESSGESESDVSSAMDHFASELADALEGVDLDKDKGSKKNSSADRKNNDKALHSKSPFGTMQTSTGFGAFGSTAQSSSTGFGAFGSTAQSSSTGFGAFGNTAQSSSTGFGAFGGSSATSTGPFGGSSKSSGPFGSASTSSGFGAFSGSSKPGPFSQKSSTSGFGAFSSATQAPSPFTTVGSNASSSTSSPFGAFGGSAKGSGAGFGAFGWAPPTSGPFARSGDVKTPVKEEQSDREEGKTPQSGGSIFDAIPKADPLVLSESSSSSEEEEEEDSESEREDTRGHSKAREAIRAKLTARRAAGSVRRKKQEETTTRDDEEEEEEGADGYDGESSACEGEEESSVGVEEEKQRLEEGEEKESSVEGDGKKESSVEGDGKKESSVEGDGKKESSVEGDGKKESSVEDKEEEESSVEDKEEEESSVEDKEEEESSVEDKEEEESSVEDKEEEESSVEDKEEEESSVEDKEEEESSVEDEEVPEDEKSITLGEGEGKRDQSVVEEVKETNKDKHEGTASGSGEVPLGDPLHATEAPEENKTSEEADEVEGESSSSEEEAVKLPSPFKSSLQRKISDISKDGLSPKKKGGSSPSRRLLESVKSKSEAKKDTIIEEEKATEEKPAFSGTFGSSSSTCFGAFGSTAQSSSTGFGAFGSTAQSSSTGFGAFGSTAQSSSTGFGAFGSTAQSSSTGFGAFGSTAQSSSTGFGAFGSTAQSSSTGFGAFGSTAQSSSTGFGAFGSTAQSSSTGFGAFGSTAQSSSTGFGAFGGSSASSAGPFGGSSSSSGLFGIASSSSASGGGLGAFSAASQPGTLPASKKTSSLFTPTASDKLSGAESTLEMPPSSSSVGFGIFSTSPSSAPKDGQSAATHSATKLESKPLTIGLASPETTEDKSPTKRGGGRSSPKEQHLSEASIRKVSDVARDGLSPKRKGSLSPSKRLIQGTKLKAEAAKEAVVDDEKVTSGGIFGSTTTSTAAGKPTSSGISHGLRRIRRSSVTEPTGSDWASVEKSQNKTKALLDEIAKETDDADDSREARALFSEVEKDLEQLEGFMKEANQPCRTAPEVDTNNEVWQQLIRSIDGLTDIANDDTLKQLDEIQQKNHTLNAQLDKEMLLEDEEPSETVVELKRRCEDISERIDEAYGECKKALIARRSRRQSNGNREQPKSPSCPEPSRPPIRHRPAVIVDGPTMPAPLLAPPARRRQAGAGSAIGRLANGAPQTPVRSKPSPPPTLRIQPEETVDSLRASVRRLRNPLRNRSTATAKTTSKSTTTVGALLASKPTEGKMAIATPVLALGDGKENWTENASAAGPSMWNVMRTKANVSAEIQGLWEKVSEMERRLRTLKQQQQQQQQTRHPRQALPPSVQAPMAALVDEQSPSSEETKVANLRSELRQQLNSSRAGSVGGAPSSGWSEASDYAPGSTTGAYSTPSVTNVPAARGLMFLNPLGGSGTPTFGGGRASPASSRHGSRDRQTSESPSGVSKESVKSKAAIREAVIPKTVVPPAPKLEAIPSVPPPPKLDASPIPKSVKHRTLTTSMSFGPEKAESSHPTTPDKPAFSFTSGAAAPSKPAKGDAPKKEAASIPAAAKPAGDDASAKSSAAPDGKSSEAPKPSGGLFGTPSSSSGNAFGGFGSSAQSSSSGGLFGSTSSKPATGGECGGLSSSSSSGGAFGSGSGTQSSSSTTSPFGSASSSTSSSSSSGTSKPGGLFGAPPASSPSSGGFGAPPGQSSSSGGFGAFGGTAFGQAASSSVFGQSSSSSSSTSPAFGGSAAPATSTFGSKPATASPFGAPSTSGGFGAFGAPQSSSSSASPFGAAPTSSSSGGFGAFGAKTSASPSPFGSAPSSGSGFGAFGGGGATSSSGFGAFGAASPAPQSGSGFGAFGGGGAQQPSPFGATPSGGGGGGFGSAFGSTGQSSSSGFGAFGGGNKPSTSGFGAFGGGTPAGGTGGFGAFGGSSNTQTSSGFGAFGGGGGAQSASSGFGAFGGGGNSQPQNAFSGWR